MKEQYLQSVRKLLDCPREEKERLLSRLDRALTAYLEDFPEADNTDLVANFGIPDECAIRLLEECTPTALVTERKKKSRSHRALIAVLTVLLTVTVGLAVYLWLNGGLVIIHTDDRAPAFWDDHPSEHIIYSYDD